MLAQIDRRVEICALNHSSNPVHDARAYSVPRRGLLDPPRCLSHEFCSPALVDRLAQGAQ
jgi:hypothetical protein